MGNESKKSSKTTDSQVAFRIGTFFCADRGLGGNKEEF